MKWLVMVFLFSSPFVSAESLPYLRVEGVVKKFDRNQVVIERSIDTITAPKNFVVEKSISVGGKATLEFVDAEIDQLVVLPNK